jgi:PAS domain-containing protein
VLLVSRPAAVAFALIAVAMIVGVGIVGYRTVDADIPADAIKERAELILYLAVASAVVLLLSVTIVAARTRHLGRELDKMVALNRFGDFSPELSMKKLGSIGEKITLLYFRLNALNEKRALKISALSDLVQLLALNIDTPFVVSDISGSVKYVSRGATEKLPGNRSELMNSTLTELAPALNMQLLVTRLERTNEAETLSEGEDAIIAIPVRNRRGELTYVVWVFSPEGLETESRSRTIAGGEAIVKQGLIRRIFARTMPARHGK